MVPVILWNEPYDGIIENVNNLLSVIILYSISKTLKFLNAYLNLDKRYKIQDYV